MLQSPALDMIGERLIEDEERWEGGELRRDEESEGGAN